MAAELTYYIFEGLLVGYVGSAFFHLSAGSGGGSGSRVARTTLVANNPYATGVKTAGGAHAKGHEHGGPLPLGTYTIHPSTKHAKLGRAAYLEPTGKQAMHGRGGFYIHGQGRHGSDGCIVPFEKLTFLLDSIDKENGGTLHVLETSGDFRFA